MTVYTEHFLRLFSKNIFSAALTFYQWLVFMVYRHKNYCTAKQLQKEVHRNKRFFRLSFCLIIMALSIQKMNSVNILLNIYFQKCLTNPISKKFRIQRCRSFRHPLTTIRPKWQFLKITLSAFCLPTLLPLPTRNITLAWQLHCFCTHVSYNFFYRSCIQPCPTERVASIVNVIFLLSVRAGVAVDKDKNMSDRQNQKKKDRNKAKQANKVRRVDRRTNALQTDRRTQPVIEVLCRT